MAEWTPPTGVHPKLGRLDHLGCGPQPTGLGCTRLDPGWLPFIPGTRLPFLPMVPGFTLLGVAAFSMVNPVHGEVAFRVPVYRCHRFAAALGLDDAPPGAAPDTEFVMLPPPGHNGRYRAGTPEDDDEASYDEPHREVRIGRQFLIARTVLSCRVHAALAGHAEPERPLRPATHISWTDATRWCAAHGLRLPSETEWELGCRGGTDTAFCCGPVLSREQANFDASKRMVSCEPGAESMDAVDVGSLPCNAFGLHEVHGNVWEWCQDRYSYESERTGQRMPTDESAAERVGFPHRIYSDGWSADTLDTPHRVFRGGSWMIDARRCRSAYRFWRAPDYRGGDLGFRPACPVE